MRCTCDETWHRVASVVPLVDARYARGALDESHASIGGIRGVFMNVVRTFLM